MMKKQTFLLCASLAVFAAPALAEKPTWGPDTDWQQKFGWNEALANKEKNGVYSDTPAVNYIKHNGGAVSVGGNHKLPEGGSSAPSEPIPEDPRNTPINDPVN